MKFELPKELVEQIRKSPRGIVPAGIKAGKDIKKAIDDAPTYVSHKKGNFGNTYKKIGPVSVLKSGPTAATRKQAMAEGLAKRKAKRK